MDMECMCCVLSRCTDFFACCFVCPAMVGQGTAARSLPAPIEGGGVYAEPAARKRRHKTAGMREGNSMWAWVCGWVKRRGGQVWAGKEVPIGLQLHNPEI